MKVSSIASASYFGTQSIVRSVLRHGLLRKPRQSIGIVSGIFLIAILCSRRGAPPTYKQFPHIMHTLPQCQSTLFMPFRVACPDSCSKWRSDNDVAPNRNETFYRIGLEWSFGQPSMYNDEFRATRKQTAYSKGINFQAPDAFVENFRMASSMLNQSAAQQLKNINIKTQKRMHLSLSYFCCLREQEAYWVREIMHEWIMESFPFDIKVGFDDLQCWHERENSVTTIIVADKESEVRLDALNKQLAERLETAGIPVAVPRADQMPYHVTLLGLHKCNGEGDGSVACKVTNEELNSIYRLTNDVSKTIKSNWTGKVNMRIRHEPRIPEKAEVHT